MCKSSDIQDGTQCFVVNGRLYLYVSTTSSSAPFIQTTLNAISVGMTSGELAHSNAVIIILRYLDPSSKVIITIPEASSPASESMQSTEWPVIVGVLLAAGMIVMLLAAVKRHMKKSIYLRKELLKDPGRTGEYSVFHDIVEPDEGQSYLVSKLPVDPWEQNKRCAIFVDSAHGYSIEGRDLSSLADSLSQVINSNYLDADDRLVNGSSTPVKQCEQPKFCTIATDSSNGYTIEGRDLLSVAEALKKFIGSNYRDAVDNAMIGSASSDVFDHLPDGILSCGTETSSDPVIQEGLHSSASVDENLLSVHGTLSETDLSYATSDENESEPKNSSVQISTPNLDQENDGIISREIALHSTNGYSIAGRDLLSVAEMLSNFVCNIYTDDHNAAVMRPSLVDNLPDGVLSYDSVFSVEESLSETDLSYAADDNECQPIKSSLNSSAQTIDIENNSTEPTVTGRITTIEHLSEYTGEYEYSPDVYLSPSMLKISSNQSTPVTSNKGLSTNEKIDTQIFFALGAELSANNVTNVGNDRNNDSPKGPTCSICRKCIDGKSRKLCQCGRTNCNLMAHSKCALAKYPLPSVSHPGTPPLSTAFLLCREKNKLPSP